MTETETIEIQKLKKLKKGDKIKVKGEEYIVEDFKDIYHDDESKKMAVREIILNKKKGTGDLKGKHALTYNEKTGEIKMFKGIQEREVSPGGFKFSSKKVFFSHRKIGDKIK